MDSGKIKTLNIRLSESLYSDYKQFCEESSFAVSKRVRRLIELDIEKWRSYKREMARKNKIAEQNNNSDINI